MKTKHTSVTWLTLKCPPCGHKKSFWEDEQHTIDCGPYGPICPKCRCVMALYDMRVKRRPSTTEPEGVK